MKGGRAVTFGTSDPAYRDWLIASHLPEELMRFLMENELNSHVSFDGVGGMWTPDRVMTPTTTRRPSRRAGSSVWEARPTAITSSSTSRQGIGTLDSSPMIFSGR